MEDVKTTIEHLDLMWEVSGSWEKYQPATIEEPEEGGCFYEFEITLHGFFLTEALSDKTIEAIIQKAEAKIRG